MQFSLLTIFLVGCCVHICVSQDRFYDPFSSYTSQYVKDECQEEIYKYNMTRRFEVDWERKQQEWLRSGGKVDDAVLNYFRELEQKANVRFQSQPRSTRTKRQTMRIRKEYRSLSEAERTAYHNAVNALKISTISAGISEYDAFSMIHNNAAAPAAHSGPAFLPWHRHFLYLYEEALITKDSTVSLPYWDSSIDASLANPSTSIMWTPPYMGNADGPVTTGPFEAGTPAGAPAYWSITRAANFNPSNLYTQGIINSLFANTAFTSFFGPMELRHGGPHVYIQGDMGVTQTAARDPIFFMHHAFVDCLWEEWRNDVQTLDPQTDYPSLPTWHSHYQYAPMLPWQVTANDGLGPFYSQYYRCAPREISDCNCCDGTSTPNGNYGTYSVTPYYPPGPRPTYQQVYVRLRVDYQGSNPYLDPNYRPYDPYTPQDYPSYPQQGSGCCGGTDYVYADCQGSEYDRYYRDYTGYDRRYPVSKGYTYLSLPNPRSGYGDCQLRVYTPYGRPCTPLCLQPDSYPPKYAPCCGVLNLASGNVKTYNTYAEAIQTDYGYDYDKETPYPIYYDSPKKYDGMIFYCGNEDPTYRGK